MSTDAVGFAREFKALTAHDPFPWQFELYKRLAQGDVPAVCDIPTGLGKTSVIPIWIIALAGTPKATEAVNAPRRLVYVVNRRTVVDQATEEAARLRERLAGRVELSSEERETIQRLREGLFPGPGIDGNDAPIGVSVLRGQFADNREWSADPSRPAVIIGTVDMIGSRLLFSGYGVGFKAKPLHAGFLGQDVLLVHDEAHLEPAFQELLIAIQKEQERCREFGRFRVIGLSATSRGEKAEPFGLTGEERNPPDEVLDLPTKPIEVVWCRLRAKKGIVLHTPDGGKENVADRIGKLAKKYSESHPGSSVLVFVNSLEDHATVCKALKDEHVQVLTGTLRGLERDRMANPRKETGCPIFARFLKPPGPDAPDNERWKIEPKPGTAYLVCTSAGEVGIDISADHMVCDLTTFERMAQRFGRVNRFGDGDASIDIVHEATRDARKENDPHEKARWETLALLRELPKVGERRSASPLVLMQLRERGDLKAKLKSAYAAPPVVLPVSDILFDSWALTTIRGKLPGRPPVEPYLHGVEDEKTAETYIAWREEVWGLRGLLESADNGNQLAADILEDYPLKPHELLRDSTFRRNTGVRDSLAKLAKEYENVPVWVQDPDGSVVVTTLGEVLEVSLVSRTVLLPPEAGGLKITDGGSLGLFGGDEEFQPEHRNLYDVADKWWDENGNRRRIRTWEDQAVPDGMRLVRTIDTKPDAEEEEEEGEVTSHRYWHWHELPTAADSDGSKTASKAVRWDVHTDDVMCNVTKIVQRLPLSEDLRNAVILAAKFHDLGKKRLLFQRILGNPKPDILLAKSGKRKQPYNLNDNYRHEFGSLLDVETEPEFQKLSDDMKDLVLHLIAAHHGRGRPHFPSEEAFDPEHNGHNGSLVAAAVPRRFAQLQRKYGRWGLAYLESLLRAGDYAASANPSELVEYGQ